MREKIVQSIILVMAFLLPVTSLFAAGPPVPNQLDNPMATALLIIIVALMLVIGLLAYVLLGVADIRLKRYKEENGLDVAGKIFLIGLVCLTSVPALAQEATGAAAIVSSAGNFGGMSSSAYYTMISVIGLELIIILVMLYFVKTLLAKDKPPVIAIAVEHKTPAWKVWWSKMNALKPIGEVSDTGHDYDGIRELDNKLPPWWLYGFYASIIFALVYLYRFQVAHSAPSSRQEYEIAVANALVEQEEYLKNAANKVDENTITFLTDAADIEAGKKMFGTACAPCHGADAQGVVGPNLTDEYWLHGGSVKDVFKTIKYGVPEKGMKSWKDDFSPVQIAQLASFIKSAQGSHPANAKEPQGEIYKEENNATTDSLSGDKGGTTKQ